MSKDGNIEEGKNSGIPHLNLAFSSFLSLTNFPPIMMATGSSARPEEQIEGRIDYVYKSHFATFFLYESQH
jgi:hypothetical protein